MFVQGAGHARSRARQGRRRVPGRRGDTREAKWVDDRVNGINTLLNLLYVLLALSVIVSLFGMVNTLVLSVFERTREIGMLRAVGMSRRQVRRMVRQESIITALIGAALGLPLGLLLAGAAVERAGRRGRVVRRPVRVADRVHDRGDHRRRAGGDRCRRGGPRSSTCCKALAYE